MSRLEKLMEKVDEPNIVVSLQIRLPLSNYEQISNGANPIDYAKRDKRGAIARATHVILKYMKLSRLPYNVEIVPSFRYIKDGKAWWSVKVSGGEKNFLSKLKSFNLRILENTKDLEPKFSETIDKHFFDLA